jgi:hypothetical protein
LIDLKNFLRQKQDTSNYDAYKSIWRNKVIFNLEIKIFDLSADETNNNQILKTLIIMGLRKA